MKFYTEFIDMIIISHHTKFHMSSSSGSSVIIIELRTKYEVEAPAMFTFYKIIKAEVAYFFQELLP